MCTRTPAKLSWGVERKDFVERQVTLANPHCQTLYFGQSEHTCCNEWQIYPWSTFNEWGKNKKLNVGLKQLELRLHQISCQFLFSFVFGLQANPFGLSLTFILKATLNVVTCWKRVAPIVDWRQGLFCRGRRHKLQQAFELVRWQTDDCRFTSRHSFSLSVLIVQLTFRKVKSFVWSAGELLVALWTKITWSLEPGSSGIQKPLQAVVSSSSLLKVLYKLLSIGLVSGLTPTEKVPRNNTVTYAPTRNFGRNHRLLPRTAAITLTTWPTIANAVLESVSP